MSTYCEISVLSLIPFIPRNREWIKHLSGAELACLRCRMHYSCDETTCYIYHVFTWHKINKQQIPFKGIYRIAEIS